MKNIVYLFSMIWFLLIGCQDKSTPKATQPGVKEEMSFESIGEENLFRQIEGFANLLKSKAEEKTDFVTAEKLIRDSKAYADKYRKNEKTPAILFRAGEVARSIKKPEEAINIFRRLYTQFPNDPFAVKAMFMEASTFEDDIKDKEQAKKAYQKVIDKYPKDLLADQAKQLLEVIDKSPEELIKEFQKRQ